MSHLNITGHLVVKNNLFVGLSRQKVFQGLPAVSPRAPDISDYNAYYFDSGDTVRYIGYGLQRVDMGGVARVRQELGLDQKSVEPAPEHVRFVGRVPIEYVNQEIINQFHARFRQGQINLTLAMFDLPAGSPLNTAGENGAPIGARPVRR